MKNGISLLHVVIASACRIPMFRSSSWRFLLVCLSLLGGLLLAGSPVEAATIRPGDILVADQLANKLLLVNPVTGVRSVISDFSNPAQGPVNQQAITGVAVGHGQIFVTDLFTGIFAVDPRTGNRTLLSNLNQGAVQGNLFYGVAVDSLGRVVANLAPTGVVRVVTSTDTRILVTDFAKQMQGPVLSSCCFMTDLTLERSGAILIGTSNNNGGHSAIYRVDPVTGFRSLLSDFTNSTQGTDVVDLFFSDGLAVERSGQILANSGSSIYAPRSLLLRIDPVTGNRTVLSDFDNPAQGPLGNSLEGIALEKSGNIVVGVGIPGSANATRLFRVDRRTGMRTMLSDGTNPQQGLPFGVVVYLAVVQDDAGFYQPPPNFNMSPFGPSN